jgi:hypothetical protein
MVWQEELHLGVAQAVFCSAVVARQIKWEDNKLAVPGFSIRTAIGRGSRWEATAHNRVAPNFIVKAMVRPAPSVL